MLDAIQERGASVCPDLLPACTAMQRDLDAIVRMAERSRDVDETGPEAAIDDLSCGVLLEGCRRFEAELGSTRHLLVATPDGTTKGALVERCDLMVAELNGLMRFATRFSLLVEHLPDQEPLPIERLLADAAVFFGHRFPLCPFGTAGDPHSGEMLAAGNLYWLALRELLANGGQAAGRHGAVQLFWKADESRTLAVVNSGEPWPQELPCDSVPAFDAVRGRHEGLGLAIARRICGALGAELRIRPNLPNAVVAMIVMGP
jgi:hypothetical protein